MMYKPDETKKTGFILLMPWGRVGSNTVTGILQQSKKCKLVNEKFTGIKSQNPDCDSAEIAQMQQAWFSEFFGDETIARRPGAKLSAMSIEDLDWFCEEIQRRNIDMIYMDRRNVLKIAISALKAEMYATYHKEKYGNPTWAVKKGREMKEKIVIDTDKLDRYLNICEEASARFEHIKAEKPGLDIFYEDILSDLDREVVRINQFLNLDHYEYEVPFVKATADNLEDAIRNYGEVCDFVKSRNYGHMLAA